MASHENERILIINKQDNHEMVHFERGKIFVRYPVITNNEETRNRKKDKGTKNELGLLFAMRLQVGRLILKQLEKRRENCESCNERTSQTHFGKVFEFPLPQQQGLYVIEDLREFARK